MTVPDATSNPMNRSTQRPSSNQSLLKGAAAMNDYLWTITCQDGKPKKECTNETYNPLRDRKHDRFVKQYFEAPPSPPSPMQSPISPPMTPRTPSRRIATLCQPGQNDSPMDIATPSPNKQASTQEGKTPPQSRK